MKKVTKKVVAPKAKAKIVKKPVRKYEPGGVVGVTPKKTKTAAELAQEAEGKGSSVVASAAEVPGITKAALPKKRADGFASDAQKAAYIKNTKNLLKTKSVADLVSMKHGTAAGLAALGFKDSPKASAPATSTKKEGLALKEKGQALKAKGAAQAKAYEAKKNQLTLEQKKAKAYRDQIVDTKSTYGKTKGNKSISTVVSTRRSGDKLVKVTSVDKGSATGAGWKTAYKVIPNQTQISNSGRSVLHINKKGTTITQKNKKTGDLKVVTAKNLKWKPGKELTFTYTTGTNSKIYNKKK